MCVTVADFESTKIPLHQIQDFTTFFALACYKDLKKNNCLNYPKWENIWTTKSKWSNIKKSLLSFIFLNFLINQSKVTQWGWESNSTLYQAPWQESRIILWVMILVIGKETNTNINNTESNTNISSSSKINTKRKKENYG